MASLLDFDMNDPKTMGLLNLGLGILAGNTGRPGDLGQGIMHGLGNYQAMQQQNLVNQQRQTEFDMRRAQMEREAAAEQRRAEAMASLFGQDPQLAAIATLDPEAALKQAFPKTIEAEYGLVPKAGINPKTGKPDMYVQDKMGGTKWLGIEPMPEYQFQMPTPYQPGYGIDKRDPTRIVPIGGVPQQSPTTVPTQRDTNAPWSGVVDPEEQDRMRQRVYDQAQERLKGIRERVSTGEAVARDLTRFGELNRNTATGSALDRYLPGGSWTEAKQEMESIAARLAPQQRQEGSGAASDRDVALYLQGLPGVDKLGNTNKAIRDNYMRDLGSARTKLSFYEAYLNEYGHLNGVEDAFKRAQEVPVPGAGGDTNTRPAKAARQQPGPRSRQFTLDDGSKVLGVRGNDGNYYVTRNGKRFRIEE